MTDDERTDLAVIVRELSAVLSKLSKFAKVGEARPMRDETFALPPIKAVSFPNDGSPGWIARDVIEQDMYGLKRIPFAPGDVVVDIGAHVGIVSVYVASLCPGIRVVAFEPLRPNYEHLLKTLAANPTVQGIEPQFFAITGDGRDIEIGSDEGNTGGATLYGRGGQWRNRCSSLTLDAAMDRFGISRIKLLKLDVERAEYEILQAFTRWDAVEYLTLEIHNDGADKREALLKLVYSHLPEDHVFLSEA